MGKMEKSFTVVIERDEDGYYVGSVPAIKGCHSQGKTMDELLFNIREAVELCLEVENDIPEEQFVGIHEIHVKI
jgi:predicted RNase H-like HicB family nuclease